MRQFVSLSSFNIVLFTTFVCFCSFYAPQPLLPMFSTVFGIHSTTSAWLLTLPFICLAVGPILVGSVLQRASAQRVLAIACLVLSLALLGFVLSSQFKWLLFFRAIQSMMLPIIFTAAVTYCSKAGEAAKRQTRIALYITATIVGGFSGRLIGGFLGEAFGWQAPFYLFSLLAVACAVLVWFFVEHLALDEKPLRAKQVFSLIRRADIRSGLAFVFATFFTFAGTLNVIPFRLVELEPDISASRIALVYVGYAVGIFIPMIIRWVVERSGGELPTLFIGYILLLIGLLGLFVPSANFMLIVFLVLSMGMFTVHATASGLLNNFHADNASLVNGAYISNYYSAAAVGSIFPVWVVTYFGWSVYVAMQLCIALSALWHFQNLKKSARQTDGA